MAYCCGIYVKRERRTGVWVSHHQGREREVPRVRWNAEDAAWILGVAVSRFVSTLGEGMGVNK